MRIALTGMKGVGKTTLGELLARSLSLPFYDTDREIEALHGKTGREIFYEEGETVFRALEAKVVRKLASLDRGIVALGGGTLLDPESFKLIVPTFRLILLEEEREILAARMRSSPLLRGTDFETFYAKRMAHYAILPAERVKFTKAALEERLSELLEIVMYGK